LFPRHRPRRLPHPIRTRLPNAARRARRWQSADRAARPCALMPPWPFLRSGPDREGSSPLKGSFAIGLIALRCASAALGAGVLLSVQNAHADQRSDETRHFDVPAQPLSAALVDFAQQAHARLLYSDRQFDGLYSKPVQGDLSIDSALIRLLEGTGFTGRLE